MSMRKCNFLEWMRMRRRNFTVSYNKTRKPETYVDYFILSIESTISQLPPMHPEARNTAVLALLWTVWKSRNRMVFDTDFMSTPRILAMLVDHLRLWVVRAPPRVDTSALLSWCQAIS
jgi:hypothetical protein